MIKLDINFCSHPFILGVYVINYIVTAKKELLFIQVCVS